MTRTADDATPKLGDRIQFRAATRWSNSVATRKVNGFYLGMPTVRYSGCANFVVRPDEIMSVEQVSA